MRSKNYISRKVITCTGEFLGIRFRFSISQGLLSISYGNKTPRRQTANVVRPVSIPSTHPDESKKFLGKGEVSLRFCQKKNCDNTVLSIKPRETYLFPKVLKNGREKIYHRKSFLF
jgi:hypothetical protein